MDERGRVRQRRDEGHAGGRSPSRARDRNAYDLDCRWKKTPRPGHRDYLGYVSATLEEMNRRELVLGTKTRSGQQWDVWESVYSPVGPDGYPKRIWDKTTGEIDRDVALYWREHYDLSHIIQRDWHRGLGTRLEGKIHLYVGDMDNYYLNNALYLLEPFLKATKNPHYNGEVDYGDRAEHCWNGDQTRPELPVTPALPPDVHSKGRHAHGEGGAGRRGCEDVEILRTGPWATGYGLWAAGAVCVRRDAPLPARSAPSRLAVGYRPADCKPGP